MSSNIYILINLAVLQIRAREVPGTLTGTPVLCHVHLCRFHQVPPVSSARIYHLPSEWCVPPSDGRPQQHTHRFQWGYMWLCIGWRHSCEFHSINILRPWVQTTGDASLPNYLGLPCQYCKLLILYIVATSFQVVQLMCLSVFICAVTSLS